MVALRKEDIYVTPEEYLAGERLADTKHEYLAGVVHAMSGGSLAHARISGNIASELNRQLRGKPCEAFALDLKVRIRFGESEFFYYPDALVNCSTGGDSRQHYIEEPTVIFEVLSPSTERIDKSEKFSNYSRLPSLRVYALVDQYRPVVMLYRRESGGDWREEFHGSIDDTLALPEIDCALPLTAIYERMGF
jgi:Uma2 family endonuclease